MRPSIRLRSALLVTLLSACARQPATVAHDVSTDASIPDAGMDGGPAVDDAGPSDVDGGPIHTPLPLSSIAKVKNLLVGLPPTDAEVDADAADLANLIDQWRMTPEYDAKMTRFFSTAFQQSEVTFDALRPQYLGLSVPPFLFDNRAKFIENVAESFGRTVSQLVAEGQPFNTAMTTRRFMMTPALLAAYGLLDVVPVSDDTSRLFSVPPYLDHTLTIESATPIPFEESVDPASPNFMRFYDANAAHADPGCPVGEIVFPAPISADLLQQFILGNVAIDYFYNPITHALVFTRTAAPPGVIQCRKNARPLAEAFMTAADFSSWRMVTFRLPNEGEAVTPFYNLTILRTTNEAVFAVPRVGFFSTLSFLGQWSTNQSNLARVTANQTMIVGLGLPFDLSNTTVPNSLAALDQRHAAPGTACYDCHQALDPMRQFFRQSYTLAFSAQDLPAEQALPGEFAFHGVRATGTSIFDLGSLLATHPLLATAWVQKLCTYANSARCDETDPEFQRLVQLFVSSNYSWNALVRALFSSPLVTTMTPEAVASGQPIPMSRRSHICATLSNRLHVTDACGLQSATPVPDDLLAAQTVAATWPSDQYGRGNPMPVLANSPTLFTRTGLEKICAGLAVHLVDNPNTGRYASTASSAAIRAFASDLMGVRGAARTQAKTVLEEHFAAAQASGETASDALKSTFVLACQSPWVAGVGL